MSDVVVPNFHKRVAAGDVIINPLSLVVTKMMIPDDTITHKSVGYDPYTPSGSSSAHYMRGTVGYLPQQADFLQGNGSLPGIPVTLDEDHEIDLRKQASLAFVDQPMYGFGEDFAEIKETIEFIRDPLESLRNLWTRFEKRARPYRSGKQRLKTYAGRARAIADVWASYSFAAAPLYRSIESGIEALLDTSVLPLRRTSRSKGEITASTKQVIEGTHLPSGTRGKVTVVNSRTTSFHVGIIYDAPQRAGLHNEIRAKLGLRDKDLITTAWEVVPMSFMVDRVITVKKSIEGLLNLIDPTVDMKGAFLVRKSLDSHQVTLNSVVPGDIHTAITAFSPQPHLHEIFTMERDEWIPNLSASLPLLNPKELIRDATATADLASLLTKKIVPYILRS
jgi:hypothetical protein